MPDCAISDASARPGNAAGTGALIALLSAEARREIERVVRTVEKIETAVEPRFQEHFVDAMAFPHATAPYPNLARVVDLPARSIAASAGPTQLQPTPASPRRGDPRGATDDG